jgi:hypothetical protein
VHRYARQIAARILGRDHFRDLGKPAHRLGADIRHRPPGDVVNNDRQITGIGQRLEMREHPFRVGRL